MASDIASGVVSQVLAAFLRSLSLSFCHFKLLSLTFPLVTGKAYALYLILLFSLYFKMDMRSEVDIQEKI